MHSIRWLLALLLLPVLACSSAPGSASPDSGSSELSLRITSPTGTAHVRGTLTVQYVTSGSPEQVTLWLDDAEVKDIPSSGSVDIDTASLSETAHVVAIHARRGARDLEASFALVVDRTPPVPEFRSPGLFETNVANRAPAVVRFSEPVVFDPQQPPIGFFTVSPAGGPGIPVNGALTLDPDRRTLRFTPDAGWGGAFPFSDRDVYLTLGIDPLTDLAGNPLAYFDWSFNVSPWIRQGPVAAGPLSRPIPKALWALNSLLLPHEPYGSTFDVVALDGGAWVPVGDLTEVVSPIYERPAIAGDATHLYAAANSRDGMNVMTWDGSHWTKVGQTLEPGVIPTIELLQDHTPTVAYRDFSFVGVAVYALDGGTWTQLGQTLPVVAESGLPVSYTVGADGTPWLALVEQVGNAEGVVLRRWTGSDWAVTGTPLTTPAVAESPTLVADRNANVLVAHRRQMTDGGHTIRVMRMVGGAWEQLGTDASFDAQFGDIDAPPGLGLLSDGGAVLAFGQNWGGGRLEATCFWVGGTWRCEPDSLRRFTLPGDITPVGIGKDDAFFTIAAGLQVGVEVYGPNR